MAKNSNGEGSIYRDKSKRGRWVGAITITDPTTGERKRRKVIGATRDEVRERLERLKTTSELGDGLPDRVTVGRFLEYWATDVLPQADVSPVTVDGYRRIIRLYVIPALGRIRLDELTPAHVRRMLTKLEEQSLSGNTRRQARSVLRRALRTAEADGLVARNVAAIVDGVKVGRSTKRSMTPEQARTLLTAAHGYEYGALVALLVATGLRKGEALALSWPSVDLDSEPATLTVTQSLKIAADHTTYIDEPKTAGSFRRLHLPAPVTEILRSHRERQTAEREEFGEDWGGKWAASDLVFTSSIGTPLDPHRVARAVKSMTADVLGEVFTPHEMRHSAASLLIAQGVPLKTVSEMLGHSSIRVTADTYGHLFEPAKTEASDAMTAALFG